MQMSFVILEYSTAAKLKQPCILYFASDTNFILMMIYCSLFRLQGPISEALHTPSRLTVLSESVMNSQALNDMEDEGKLN